MAIKPFLANCNLETGVCSTNPEAFTSSKEAFVCEPLQDGGMACQVSDIK